MTLWQEADFYNSNVTKGASTNGGKWVLLGRFNFATSGSDYVQLSNANGRVTADAIKFVYADPLPPPSTVTNLYYLHTDQLGTPRTATDTNKKLIWRWDSDPFGAISPDVQGCTSTAGAGCPGAVNDDPDNDGVKVTLNLRFPGQYDVQGWTNVAAARIAESDLRCRNRTTLQLPPLLRPADRTVCHQRSDWLGRRPQYLWVCGRESG